jgi:hypothetical protein
MLYCPKCGQYLLWDRDHWCCIGCGASPWRCECKPVGSAVPTPRSELDEMRDEAAGCDRVEASPSKEEPQ